MSKTVVRARKAATWTAAEVDALRAGLKRGDEAAAIAEAMGRTRKSVVAKIRDLGLSDGTGGSYGGAHVVQAVQHLIPPPARHSSITAWMTGDPLPGRSALDQRQGKAA